MNQIQKPEWKWYYFFPFTRGRKDYIKDRELYENQFLTKIQLIRKKQNGAINGVSVLLIALITTLWTLIPPLVDIPNWLDWMRMGMEDFGGKNWGNQLMLTIIPTSAGTLYHKFPALIPNKGLKIGVNIVMKILPIIILCLVWWMISQERQIIEIKKAEKIKAVNLFKEHL